MKIVVDYHCQYNLAKAERRGFLLSEKSHISVIDSIKRPFISALDKYKSYQFLFEELVKRDFKKKYKRTVLGMVWSVLSPLLTLLVMKVVFTQFFGRTTEHYTTYIFAGNLIYSYFRESTSGGMTSLMYNKAVILKVPIPKYLFVFSNNISALVNFLITLVIFFIFAAFDGVSFSFNFLTLILPCVCLLVFNIGCGLILSALFVFFRDTQYLYNVFTMLLMYVSAIFYTLDRFTPEVQKLFLLNPVYVYIKYFRVVVIDGVIPSLEFNLLAIGYAALVFAIGSLIYKKENQRFLYYM